MTQAVQQFTPKNKKVLEVSQAAIAHIRRKIAGHSGGIALRLSVKQAGCSGYQYVTDIIEEVNTEDLPCPLAEDLTVYIDRSSLIYLEGLKIDYVEKDLGLKRLVFINPNEKSQCGCGESFHV